MTAQVMTKVLQDDLKSIMTSFKSMFREVQEIEDAYNKTDIQATLSPLAGSDAATLNTKITKDEFVSGIVMCQEIGDFFNNEAVTTGDYISTCQKIQYGDAGTPTKRSEATESIGDRLLQVSLDCLELYKQCKNAEKVYNDNEITDMVANFDQDRIIWGSDMTRNDCSNALVLVGQWKALMGNSAVTQGDYMATIAKWERITT